MINNGLLRGNKTDLWRLLISMLETPAPRLTSGAPCDGTVGGVGRACLASPGVSCAVLCGGKRGAAGVPRADAADVYCLRSTVKSATYLGMGEFCVFLTFAFNMIYLIVR